MMKNALILILVVMVITLSYLNFGQTPAQSPQLISTPMSKSTASAIAQDTSASQTLESLTHQYTENKEATRVTVNNVTPSQPLASNHSLEKQQMCIENNQAADKCEVNLSLNIERLLINQETGSTNAEKTILLLESTNFSEVMNQLASTKYRQKAFDREAQYNSKLNDFLNTHYEHIQSDGIFCGESVCGIEFRYDDVSYINDFNKNYAMGGSFTSFDVPDDEMGNKRARIIFTPESTSITFKTKS